jgi:hypothetical protein
VTPRTGFGGRETGGMSDKDWEALHEYFDTADLLSAVDSVDALRGYLNDREHFQAWLKPE